MRKTYSEEAKISNTSLNTLIVFSIGLLFILTLPSLRTNSVNNWLIGHIFVPAVYGVLLYLLISKPLKNVQNLVQRMLRFLGRGAFYPYLIHIPFLAWGSHLGKKIFNNDILFNRPFLLLLLTGLMYLCCAYYKSWGIKESLWSTLARLKRKNTLSK